MTYPELHKLDTPSVSMLNVGTKSTENGVRVFQLLVLNIVKFLGAEWSEEQIKDCGKICFDEANYLTFAELSHFAKKAKSGGFEKVYGKFTPATFMDWFTIYTTQNLEERAMYHSNNKKGVWIEPENPVQEERIMGFLKDFTESMQKQIQTEQAAEFLKRDEQVKKHNDLLKSKLTPEQLQELEKDKP